MTYKNWYQEWKNIVVKPQNIRYWLWAWVAHEVGESKGEIVPEKWKDSKETATEIWGKSRVLTSLFTFTKFSQFSPTIYIWKKKKKTWIRSKTPWTVVWVLPLSHSNLTQWFLFHETRETIPTTMFYIWMNLPHLSISPFLPQWSSLVYIYLLIQSKVKMEVQLRDCMLHACFQKQHR